ncbi:MAG: hypothetical protein ABMA64_13645 [Myxococcota bacterium]
MKHVFVETNWLFDVVSPAHRREPDAVALLERAASGAIALHLPAICISEARKRIPERAAVKKEADALRNFVRWARRDDRVTQGDADAVHRVLNQMESGVTTDLAHLDERLHDLVNRPGVDVFPLTEPMHRRSLDLALHGPAELESFDQAILAAVLVRGEGLRASDGVAYCTFCEKDHDLLPWSRRSEWKPGLRQIYDTTARHNLAAPGDPRRITVPSAFRPDFVIDFDRFDVL